MPMGMCEFQPGLMKKEEYFWLRPRVDKYHAKCEVYKKEFSVSWDCESAIKKHHGGDKHSENMKLYQSSKKGLSSLFFRKFPTSSSSPSSTATSNASSAAAYSPSNQTMIDQMVPLQALVTTAECHTILRIVKNHDSFRSCLGLGDDLKAMFSDSAIAAGFTLSKTKCAYVVKYGMAPWLKENL